MIPVGPRAVLNMPFPIPERLWPAVHKNNHVRRDLYLGELDLILDLCVDRLQDPRGHQKEGVRQLYEKINRARTKVVNQLNEVYQ